MNIVATLFDQSTSANTGILPFCCGDLIERLKGFVGIKGSEQVALLLLSLKCPDGLLTVHQRHRLCQEFYQRVNRELPDDLGQVHCLDDETLAVMMTTQALNNRYDLISQVNNILRLCSRPYCFDGRILQLDVRGGLSTRPSKSYPVSSLVSFSRLALKKAEKYKVFCYPPSHMFFRKF